MHLNGSRHISRVQENLMESVFQAVAPEAQNRKGTECNLRWNNHPALLTQYMRKQVLTI